MVIGTQAARWAQRWCQLFCVFALVITALLSWAPPAGAQIPDSDLPVIDSPITDRAQALSSAGKAAISKKILAHREATGVQLAVLVVDTTAGEPIEDYALRVATRWRGGAKGRDDGALFVLALSDRRMRLEVGYGLEGRVPDARAKQIIAAAIPHLKKNDNDMAVADVVDRFIEQSGGASEPRPLSSPPEAGRRSQLWDSVGFYALVFLLGTVVGRLVRRRADAAHTKATAASRSLADIPNVYRGPRHYIGRNGWLWMVLFVFGTGTAGSLMSLGWFHYEAAMMGVLAGWLFMWERTAIFVSFHYLFMVTGFSTLPAVVIMAFTKSPEAGLLATFVGQLLVTTIYGSSSSSGGGTSFSSTGVSSSSSRSSSFGSSSRSSSFGSSSSSSTFGSSSSSSFGSSSSSSSFGSSSSSSSYGGGGGSFGGGGASSSW